MTKDLVPIAILNPGEEGIVMYLSGGKSLTTRLASMGIALNMRIKVLQSSGGLLIVQIGDTRVALGKGEAEKILVYRIVESTSEERPEPARRKILVALAGQPNVGKSTVFNILTGLSQHVGNWPGKTVEKKEGIHIREDIEMHIIDLPGTYSLTAFSEEERISRDFIFTGAPDVIVLLANAAILERSLYLLSELLLLGPPVIVALNMMDVAESQGISIDVKALQRYLGIPVVSMVAKKNRGIRELVTQVIATADKKVTYDPRMPEVFPDHQTVFTQLMDLIKDSLQPPYTPRWAAIKLMEGDAEISTMIEGIAPPSIWNEILTILALHEDSLHAVVGGRYDWIEEVARAAVSRFKRGQVLMTDRIDHVLTRPIFGIPILLFAFALVFLFTYSVGFPLQRALEYLVSTLAVQISPLFDDSPLWLKGVVIDGVIGGVGSVLTFLPILLIFFTVMALMEDVGYMARAAFVMDRFMHMVGLHGKSFIPLCLGFGCNVPAVMGTRILDAKRERLLTILLTPFVPCTARLAVLIFVSTAVFGKQAAPVAWSLLAINILLLGLTGKLVNRFFLKKEEINPFIMELPLYHKPDLQIIGKVVWNRIMAFVKKAGTVILIVSVALWVLSYLPYGRLDDSILAWVGRFLEPIGRPMGLDWKMLTALLTSIVAKENAIAALGVLYGVGEEGLIKVLPTVISHASALSFLVALMLFLPCAATVVVMKQEMENNRWFAASFVLMLAISFFGSVLAYRFALWAGL